MRTPSPRLPAILVTVLATSALPACDGPAPDGAGQIRGAAVLRPAAGPASRATDLRPVDFRADVRFPAIAAPHDRSTVETCPLSGPGTPVALVASEAGLAVAWSGASEGAVRVQRLRGAGCALEPAGDPVAAGALLDADDAGRVYVFPAASDEPGLVSTMLPGEYPGSMVARVDAAGRVVKLLPAGRGIWGFGIAPGGDALWVSACGPNGIFSVEGEAVVPSLLAPNTLWHEGSVLTDAGTLFSLGYQTCAWDAPLTERCGFELVRTTAEGSTALGSTIADFGAGGERATLSRCGSRVCGVYTEGVRIWTQDGGVVATLDRAALGAVEGEHVEAASGNSSGVYVLLQGERTARVVFTRP